MGINGDSRMCKFEWVVRSRVHLEKVSRLKRHGLDGFKQRQHPESSKYCVSRFDSQQPTAVRKTVANRKEASFDPEMRLNEERCQAVGGTGSKEL